MKEQVNQAIDWVKAQSIDACITGSCLLDYFEGQDVDVFVYDEKSFNKILFAAFYDSKLQILDKLEQWKFDEYINKGQSSYKKIGLVTIKFKYNLCVDVNIILKKEKSNIFSVLSSFDMNVISKGYDLRSGKTLDLTEGSAETKIVEWNKWNNQFYDFNIWTSSRILRQIERCIKYHNRGYNTDNVVLKYIELINQSLEHTSIFNSDSYEEKLSLFKENAQILKGICELWLKTHTISEEELELLRETIRKI